MSLLTKSKFMSGVQCSKYLWIALNDKNKIHPTDAAKQFIFDQGHEVGDLAKNLFPGGIDIPYLGFMESINQTKELLSERKPIFEASIMVDNLYSRIDILNPVEEDVWDIIEVKSSTSVKDEHIDDAAFQKYCCEQAGLKIRKCHLMHIDNEYVRDGDINFEELFHIADISEEINVIYSSIPQRVKDMFEVISQSSCPDVSIGTHCLTPYECPLKGQCWSFLPENSVFNLYYMKKQKRFELLEQGLQNITDVPDYYELSDKQRIQKLTLESNKAHIEAEAIKSFIEKLHYPLYYLDFETFSPAIPLYEGTSPYKKIPFQYSLHVVKEVGAIAEHYFFLSDGSSDPRPLFLSSLKDVIGNMGSVVVYNQSFEQGVLEILSDEFPENKTWIENVVRRMVDLLDPFKAFHYYHPDQNGSASIKKVLPALTGQGYEGMEISEGDEASRTFVNVFIKGSSDENKQKVKKDLEDYCRLDTQAMIDIVNKLKYLIKV